MDCLDAESVMILEAVSSPWLAPSVRDKLLAHLSSCCKCSRVHAILRVFLDTVQIKDDSAHEVEGSSQFSSLSRLQQQLLLHRAIAALPANKERWMN